jgi:thiamine transporter ThiT
MRDYKASSIEIYRRNVLLLLFIILSTKANIKEALLTFINLINIDFNNISLTSIPLLLISFTRGYKVSYILIIL